MYFKHHWSPTSPRPTSRGLTAGSKNLSTSPDPAVKPREISRGQAITFKLCVMGNPIQHSQSPWIHQQFAQQFGLALSYIKIEPEIHAFRKEIEQFKQDGGYGLNITSPFKPEAYLLASEHSKRAKIAKSVNTILFKADNTVFGDNTDGLGLLNDITKNLGFSLENKQILILGAGGAVRGILHPILSQSPSRVILANRTTENAQQLASEFKSYGVVSGCGFGDLEHLKVDVVIDGTGFHSKLFLPETLTLSEESLCYDLKYSNKPTSLINWAAQKGCHRRFDGLGMLVEQAAEAFYLWTGKKPDTQSVIQLGTKKIRSAY